MDKHFKKKADLLITNGLLLPLPDNGALIQNGAVAIYQDKIVALGPQEKVTEEFTPKNILDAQGGLIMPGLVNGHNHAAM